MFRDALHSLLYPGTSLPLPLTCSHLRLYLYMFQACFLPKASVSLSPDIFWLGELRYFIGEN